MATTQSFLDITFSLRKKTDLLLDAPIQAPLLNQGVDGGNHGEGQPCAESALAENNADPSLRYAPTITGGKIDHCNRGARPIPKIIGMLAV